MEAVEARTGHSSTYLCTQSLNWLYLQRAAAGGESLREIKRCTHGPHVQIIMATINESERTRDSKPGKTKELRKQDVQSKKAVGRVSKECWKGRSKGAAFERERKGRMSGLSDGAMAIVGDNVDPASWHRGHCGRGNSVQWVSRLSSKNHAIKTSTPASNSLPSRRPEQPPARQ